MKKSLIFWFAAVTCAALFLVGCESPTNGEKGAAGAPGTIYLSGDQTTAGIQHAIDSGAPLVFAGVTQSDGGTVVIPAGRGVELVGTAAYTTAATTGILLVGATSSVTGTGTLVANSSSGTVIAPEGVNATTSGGSVIRIQEGDETIVPASVFAVRGPITISGTATSATNIKSDGLSTHKLYVIGDVEVSAAITTAPTITVLGDVTVKTADQTQAVVWDIKGDLDAQKLPTTTTGTLKVGGNAVFTEGVTTITGAIDIGGNATFKAALTTGAGKVTVGGNLGVTGAVSLGAGGLEVGGTATLDSTLTNTAAATATFNGTTTTGAVTTSTGDLTIAGKGAVTLGAVTTATSANLVVTNETGVTIPTATIVASTSIDASAGKVIFGTATNSVTITNGTLKSGTGGTAGAAANGAVTLTYSSDGGSLELEDGGSIVTAGTGSVTTPGLKIGGSAATTVTGISDSKLTKIIAGDGTTTLDINNSGGGAAGNGILIGTAADGVQLLAVGTDAMVYTFTPSTSTGNAPVLIEGAFITAPADGTTGAIIAATTADKAKIVLGTASGGIRLGQGDHGGKLTIAYSSGGSTIGVFNASSHNDGNLPASVGVNSTDAQSSGAKVKLGATSSGTAAVGSGGVTAFGTKGSGYAEINSSLTLEADG